MLYTKQHYKSLKFNGYNWGCFDNGLHHFIKRTSKGYLNCACNETDLINGNIQFMTLNQLTRV